MEQNAKIMAERERWIGKVVWHNNFALINENIKANWMAFSAAFAWEHDRDAEQKRTIMWMLNSFGEEILSVNLENVCMFVDFWQIHIHIIIQCKRMYHEALLSNSLIIYRRVWEISDSTNLFQVFGHLHNSIDKPWHYRNIKLSVLFTHALTSFPMKSPLGHIYRMKAGKRIFLLIPQPYLVLSVFIIKLYLSLF